jgi:adenylosuccinate synthase
MLSELKILKLSKKVKEYIKKVEEEIGNPVLLKSVQDVGLHGMDSVFKQDPIYTCGIY